MALPNDWNWIVAGILATALVVWLALGVNVPFIIAVVIAAFAFGGLVLLLSPRRLFEGIDVKAIGRGRVAFARDLLTEATPSLDKLKAMGEQINDEAAANRVQHLVAIASDVFAEVEATPANATTVKRFLAYYLPQAAQVAEVYNVLEDQRAPDQARLTEIREIIEKLETAFAHYADSLAEAELGPLDTDLKLIEASLKEDLGR